MRLVLQTLGLLFVLLVFMSFYFDTPTSVVRFPGFYEGIAFCVGEGEDNTTDLHQDAVLQLCEPGICYLVARGEQESSGFLALQSRARATCKVKGVFTNE